MADSSSRAETPKQTLSDIANRAAALASVYPKAARDLLSHRKSLAEARNDGDAEHVEQLRHAVNSYRRLCEECRVQLRDLALLVLTYLPDLRLAHVRVSPSWRYDDDAPDWSAILGELNVIEDAAYRAAETKHETSGQRKRQRGRKKADYETVQREARLAAEWKKARETSTAKTDFAKDNQHELKALDDKYQRRRPTATAMLDALLDRVASRNRNSD